MVETFIDDDNDYMDWLERHPAGFVVNAFRSPNPTYLILHRATCGTITGTPARGARWTTGGFAKICSDRRPEIDAWARNTVGGELHACRLCRP